MPSARETISLTEALRMPSHVAGEVERPFEDLVDDQDRSSRELEPASCAHDAIAPRSVRLTSEVLEPREALRNEHVVGE